MHKLIFSMLISLFVLCSTYASPDSLLVALRQANTPIEKVDALNNLAFFQIRYSFKKGIDYGLRALDLSKEIRYQRGEGVANLNLGWIYWKNSYYKESLVFLNDARRIFTDNEDTLNLANTNRIIGLLYLYIVENDSAVNYLSIARDQFIKVQDSAALTLVLTELSITYTHMGDMEAANRAAVESYMIKLNSRSIRLEYYTWFTSNFKGQTYQNELIVKSFIPKARKRFEAGKRNDPYKLSWASTEIASLFQMIEEYDSAIWYYQFALMLCDSLDENRMRAHSLMDLALCYMIIGETSKAEVLNEEAYEIFLVEKNHPGIGGVLDLLGKIALGNKQYNKAIRYFQNALTLSDTLGHLIDVVRFNRRLSDTYRKMGNTQMAVEAASRSYLLSKEIGAPNHIMWGAEKLHMAYRDAGDYQKAHEFLSIYNVLAIQNERDVLSKENLQFQAIFELNEKTKVIDDLNEDNASKQVKINVQRAYLITTISGVFIVMMFAWILNNRVKKIKNLNNMVSNQNESLKTINNEKETLLKEVHHRVKNNLQMISNLIGMQRNRIEEPETKLLFSYTQSRLKSIALIHEHLYKSDTLSTVYLKSYLKELMETILDSFQSGSKTSLILEIPEYNIDIDDAIPIGLIVNELVTNAVKYAFADHKQPQLKISLIESNEYISLIVRDNGQGNAITKDGFGWMIIKSMVKSLSGSVEVEGDQGLVVTISFPKPQT